jgi:GNAT superfamily N-acetyltransferase
MAALLSRHERDPDSFFDEARAAEDLFGDDPWLFGQMARIDEQPAGMLLWHLAYETSYAARGGFVVSLWVDEPCRRRGVATGLIAAAADRVRTRGGVYLWWASKPGNKRAHATYGAWDAGSEAVLAHALVGESFMSVARRHRASEEIDRDE